LQCVFIAIGFLFYTCSSDAKPSGAGPIAIYHLDEGFGTVIKDSSGNNQNGNLLGAVKWVPGKRGNAVFLDGLSRISIPDSPILNPEEEVTLSAWIKGHGGGFKVVREPSSYPSVRGPYFQVCGDVLYFASNSDYLEPGADHLHTNMLTGTVGANLGGWNDHQQTRLPYTGLEPKLQVVGDKIYYEYFGQDAAGAMQIWTAQSKTDGSDFTATPRTDEKAVVGESPGGGKNYRVEQGGLQISGTEIFYGWSEKDARNQWQIFTASSHLDGSAFKATQRTVSGGAFAGMQVVGEKIFYLRDTSWAKRRVNEKGIDLELAVSDKNAAGWRAIKTFERLRTLEFIVSNNRIYLAFVQPDMEGRDQLYTGSMNTDGSHYRAIERNLGEGSSGFLAVGQGGIRVVGEIVYYALQFGRSRNYSDETAGRNAITFWTAEAGTDGSEWRATQRTISPPDIRPQYKSIVVVGGKAYYSLVEELTFPEAREPFRVLFGTSGSNILNKGDGYGLGLTEWNEARGFINVGQDYLFRGEAPDEIAGATADAAIDEKWHFVATTYDRTTVRMYVDGALKASNAYNMPIGRNQFPLTIGDGFVGIIDEVAIYNRALGATEILDVYEAVSAR
jgi:hypothetical protein